MFASELKLVNRLLERCNRKICYNSNVNYNITTALDPWLEHWSVFTYLSRYSYSTDRNYLVSTAIRLL